MNEFQTEVLTVVGIAALLALAGLALAVPGHRRRIRGLVIAGCSLIFAGGLTVLAWAIIQGTGAEAAGIEMQGCGAFLNFTSWKDCIEARDSCRA